jgi:hypothetical protein
MRARMKIPRRLQQYEGRYSLIYDIPFQVPIATRDAQAQMACFTCDYEKVNDLLPGNELYAVRLPNGRAVLVVAVMNYLDTNIGKSVEYSIGLTCTKGLSQAPRVLPLVLQKTYGTGQFIVDLPVSSEISVKGGIGIWGMPKHQAQLDFKVTDELITSQYEENREFAFRLEIERPTSWNFPFRLSAVGYCAYQNMIRTSYLYFNGIGKFNIFKKAKGRLFIGDHPRVAPLKGLDIDGDPFITMFMSKATGILSDYSESWFITYDKPPAKMPEKLVDFEGLSLSQEWLDPPSINDYEKYEIAKKR